MVLLGAGGYCLTLPVAKPDPLWVTMILDVTNTLSDASNAIPSCGDVVLLGVDDTGDVLCLGMRGYKPSPDRRDTLWATDPLAGECLSNRRLSALIQAAGGALPVTVESFNEANSRLMFSRRLQLWPCGSQGGLTMGRVVGLLGHNGDQALIRTGGALLKVAVNDLVAGLPADREIQKAAAEVLRDAGFPIWLEVDAAGRVTGSGLPETDPQLTPEFAVKPFGAVGGNKGGGVLCQALHSEKLFWLSDRQLAWTQLSINQLRQHVVNRPQLWVRRQSHIGASDTISVVRADRATQELARLQVGREMLVKVIDKLAGAARTQGIYLVESFSSGVMLTCETQEELELGQHKPVEVVRRSSGSMQAVVTAPKDEQPQLLDLPKWMLASWPESRREEWTAFVARYSQPFNPEQISTEEVIAAVPSVLNEYLASADRWRSSNTDVIELQSRIALRWKWAFLEDVGQPEMEVGPALLAVLLLDRVGEVMVGSANPDQSDLGRNYSRHAVTLLMELGLRARRSLHSEVCSRALLGASLLRRRSDQLGQHLHNLESRLTKPLKVEDLEAVRSFCRAVSTRQAADFLPLASGLAAALGDLRDWRILWDKAPVCKRLIEMSRTLPAQKARLNKAIRDELRRMVDEILAQDIDIVLLDPIFLEGSDTA